MTPQSLPSHATVLPVENGLAAEIKSGIWTAYNTQTLRSSDQRPTALGACSQSNHGVHGGFGLVTLLWLVPLQRVPSTSPRTVLAVRVVASERLT